MSLLLRVLCVCVCVAIGLAQVLAAADHVKEIKSLNHQAMTAGRDIYVKNCQVCHGPNGDKPPMPQARSFLTTPLKNGADPFSLFVSLEDGVGLMPPQMHLNVKEKYAVIHYIRERFLKKSSAEQYAAVDDGYFNAIAGRIELRQKEKQKHQVIKGDGKDPDMGKQMMYGSVMHHSVELGKGTVVARGIRVTCAEDVVALYNMDQQALVACWRGPHLDLEKTHNRNHKGRSHARGGDQGGFRRLKSGWDQTARLMAEYRAGQTVVFKWRVGGRDVLERPRVVSHQGRQFLVRDFQVAAGSQVIRLNAAAGNDRVIGSGDAFLDKGALVIPAGEQQCSLISACDGGTIGMVFLPPSGSLHTLTIGGPPQWGKVRTQKKTVQTLQGYSSEELTLPYRNPWGSWLRTTAIDGFSDGRVAVSTWSGDVWVCTPGEGDALIWQRVCAGLYEPLGLCIIDDVIHVRTRDAIWSLHDRNGDGEIDVLENVHSGGVTSPGYISHIFDLDHDDEGRLYFTASGYKSPAKMPYGHVCRVTPGDDSIESLAHGLREPNGFALDPARKRLVFSDNQGQWIPSAKLTEVDLANKNDPFCGYDPKLFGRKTRQGFKKPLLYIPHQIDSSSGGQVWADADRWGPFSKQLLHTSYGKGRLFAIYEQHIEGKTNAFAWRFPHTFTTGVMRTRVANDGQLLLCGLIGYDYNGARSPHQGAVYRLSYTGEPKQLIKSVAVRQNALRIAFHKPIQDKVTISLNAWNYQWSSGYGSRTFKLDGKKGKTPWKLGDIKVTDQSIVDCEVPQLRPCDQVEISISVISPGGEKWSTTLWGSINHEPK